MPERRRADHDNLRTRVRPRPPRTARPRRSASPRTLCQCHEHGCHWHPRHHGCAGPIRLLLAREHGGRLWRLADACSACATATAQAAVVPDTVLVGPPPHAYSRCSAHEHHNARAATQRRTELPPTGSCSSQGWCGRCPGCSCWSRAAVCGVGHRAERWVRRFRFLPAVTGWVFYGPVYSGSVGVGAARFRLSCLRRLGFTRRR